MDKYPKSDHAMLYLPCGGQATFDYPAGYGYRCEDCGAVLGSIGQPQRCKDEANKYEAWRILGGEGGWNYETGVEIQ